MSEETVTLQNVLNDLSEQVMHLEKSIDDSFHQIKTIKCILAHTLKMCNKDILYNININTNNNMLHISEEGSASANNDNSRKKKVVQVHTKASSRTKLYSRESIQYMLAEYLLFCIQERKPDFKEPNLYSWAYVIDLMIRLDERNPERIKEVIEWCQKDNFWCNNILSVGKLREKFDALELKMDKKKGRNKINRKLIASDSDDPAITELLFKKYSDKFTIGTDIDFDLYSIARGANKICAYAKKLSKINIKPDKLIDLLLCCLEKNHSSKGRIIYPAMLSSEHTWSILFPQYLKSSLPSIYSLIKNLHKE